MTEKGRTSLDLHLDSFQVWIILGKMNNFRNLSHSHPIRLGPSLQCYTHICIFASSILRFLFSPIRTKPLCVQSTVYKSKI